MTRQLPKLILSACMGLLSSQSHALDSITRNANIVTMGLPAFAAGVSLLNDDTAGLVQLVKSEAVTLGIVEVLKSTIHETRPNGKDDKSFPSGHTAVAFSAAQYLQSKGGWEYGVPAYVAASFVAYARVDAREHRWRDVAAGAATGMLTTYYFTDENSGRRLSMGWTGRSALFQVQQPLK
jgi:membrane-associated phospholipid phosphatase